MTEQTERVVRASRDIAAGTEHVFELIADPAKHPSWDGNENLAEAVTGQRVRGTGETFRMTLTNGAVRENRVVEFAEGRRIAWIPAEPEQEPPGHLWRWELEPVGETHTRVTHTYDWNRLADSETMRLQRARATTADRLRASIDRLAVLAESTGE
ncbi:SRPBCC family protein [Sciscionella marina]|uniref:SRPBCC family protein n=1 Tax=Sciscionella marina TaxID=508770 RepID=UPI0003AA93A7|nr:SRPBCC family protein [Sciscionella marina]